MIANLWNLDADIYKIGGFFGKNLSTAKIINDKNDSISLNIMSDEKNDIVHQALNSTSINLIQTDDEESFEERLGFLSSEAQKSFFLLKYFVHIFWY